MAVFFMIVGLLCIGYYICSVCYAGFRISMIWIWLAGGGILLLVGGADFLHPFPFWLKFSLWLGIVGVGSLFLVMEGLILSGMRQKKVPGLSFLLVLGCKVNGERPSKALKDRVLTAAEYLRENPETRAVLSGGQGRGEEISEAECMRRLLIREGISEERLILEEHSTTTLENLTFSQCFLNRERDEVGLVTSNFHVYRSMYIGKKTGYKKVYGIGAPARTILLLHYMVRECFALLREFFR